MINLSELLTVGQNAMVTRTVQRSDTAASYSENLKELLATPPCIDMAIKGSIESIDKFLPDEYISIVFAVEFIHTATTSLGMTVTVKTTISAINEDEHEVDLQIEAWDEQGDIGHGMIKRKIVNTEALKKKAKERTTFLINRQFPR